MTEKVLRFNTATVAAIFLVDNGIDPNLMYLLYIKCWSYGLIHCTSPKSLINNFSSTNLHVSTNISGKLCIAHNDD